MEYARKEDKNCITLIPQSDLKTADAKEFEEKMLEEIKEGFKLTVDLSCVAYICSSGLRALLVAQQAVDDKDDAQLELINVGEEVMSVLRSTGFHNILTII